MGVNDMMNGNFDADASRMDRMNRTQPAQFAPGQDAVFQQQDIFAQSAVQNNQNAMGDIFSTGVNNGAPATGGVDPMNPFSTGVGNPAAQGGIPTANGFQQQPQMQGQSTEDKFWSAVGAGAKGSMSFGKELISSMKTFTPRWYSEWGRTVLITGIVVAGAGFILKLAGLSVGLKISIGGLFSSAGGVLIWLFKTEDAKNYTSKYKDENNSNQSFNNPSDMMPVSDGFGDNGIGFQDSTPAPDFPSDDFGSEDFDSYGDEDDDIYGIGGDDDDDYYGGMVEDEPQEGMNAEEALNSLPDIPKGMYERKYLWDMFTKVLPTMKPGFSEMHEIDDTEDAFLYWGDKLREAAAVAGCKEDYLPELLRLQENLFTVIVTCDRPQGFKPEAVANELANIYAYSDGEKNENVFAKVDTVGAECRITIFNGASAMISLKDMMLQEESFILDNKNYIPVILGVDQLGRVIKADFKKIESVIITGMPRSGKSWFCQAVLTQMCAFVPPSELNLYICDPKEGISDFKAFTLPHVKKFVSGDDNIVATLRNLVKVEAPRRKKIIGDAGFVNIWDYKERYPDIKMPIIYVIIDEVVTLSSRMDKETNNEFRMLLRELISQLPALGIRAFLIPHILNNDIIEKKTSALVPCKISVCGNAEHIEAATGSKPKEFPYKLVNKGDMAVKLAGFNNTLYVHGPALTDSNPKNNELFDYLRRVWSKLEPEEVAGSVSVKAEEALENKRALEQMQDMTEDIEVFSNPNEQGLSGMSSSGLPDDNDDFPLF
jgi:S-DNA-T family DNA segregation ATPase FtsK/SpoIIIE